MHSPNSYGGWGGKRSEVEFVLDSRDNGFDSAAWFLHKLHQNRHGRGSGGSGCGCGGGGCARCCWTPATAWFDHGRAYISYWRDIFDCLYGRSGCGPSHCEPACPPPCPPPCPPADYTGKLIVANVRPGGTGKATFVVVNPTSDSVALEFAVEGFRDSNSVQWVKVVAEGDRTTLAPGEARTIFVLVDLRDGRVPPATYDGTVVVKTPFARRLFLEVQVSA